MARAHEIPDIDCEETFALAAARVVDVRADEVIEHSAGVLDLDDIEPLHDMRVATRRLRAAMEIFRPCFPRKRFRAALREVKALADALGERRDPDVWIEEMAAFSAGVGSGERPGVEVMVEEFRREQETANERLEEFVRDECLARLRGELRELSRAARERAEAGGERSLR
jgi:CHAD domain-containing protein